MVEGTAVEGEDFRYIVAGGGRTYVVPKFRGEDVRVLMRRYQAYLQSKLIATDEAQEKDAIDRKELAAGSET